MRREKIEANNERKKNYKQYNRKAKAKKFTAYIPVIIIVAVVLLFAGAGAYAGYTSYKAKCQLNSYQKNPQHKKLYCGEKF